MILVRPTSTADIIERWENVLRVLSVIAADPHASEHHWNMGDWGYWSECGTVACAGGYCSLDSWFNERGLEGYFFGPSQKLKLRNFGDDWWAGMNQFFMYPGSPAPMRWMEADLVNIFYRGVKRSVQQVILEIESRLSDYRREAYPLPVKTPE